jgi:sugar phosphate isomerase/epimerase
LNPSIEEAKDIRDLAKRLHIPVVEGQTTVQDDDLWVSIMPDSSDWARYAEAWTAIMLLEEALLDQRNIILLNKFKGIYA